MASKLTVRQGGAVGATIRDFTSQVLTWQDQRPEFQAGMQADGRAGACQYQFIVSDDAGEIPTANQTGVLLSHNLVTVSENGPGYDAWLSRGRICDKDIDGGDKPWGNSRTHTVKVDDANIDLRGLDLKAVWSRPAETHHVRLLAAGAAFLNGSPRVSTVITVLESHLAKLGPTSHVMPAKDYEVGTSVWDIIDDCASTGGMRFQVVIHHLASASHLCLMYIDEADLTTFASTLSITDTSPNLTTSFPPIFDQGPAVVESGGEVPVSDMIVRWGSGPTEYVVESDSAIADRFDYWAATYNDSHSISAVQATFRAEGLLEDRDDERRTHAVTIRIPADKVDLLCAGMAITIRSARAMGGQYLNTTQTRRIASLKWELIAPDVGAVKGIYDAHMLLEVPYKVALERFGGPVGPRPPQGATTASCALDVPQMTAISTPNGGFETGLATNWTMNHISGGVNGPATGDWEGDYHYQLNAAGYAAYMGVTGLTFTAGVTYVARVRYSSVTGGSGQFGHVASGDFTLYTATSNPGWLEDCVAWTPTANRTGVEFNLGIDAGLDTFSIDDLRLYTGGVAQTPTPIGETGDAGDDTGTQTPFDHAHAHGNITTGGPYHMAEDVTFSPTGTIAATTVQAAIAEAASEAVQKASFTAAGDSLVGTGAGTLATRKHNESATVAPTVNDDSGDGYAIGSRWLDTTADKEYVATDVTVGAAVWKETTATGGSGLTIEEVDGTPTVSATKLVLPNGTLGVVGTVATYTPAGGGGGGADWLQDINESGASFANFTANTGTWASNGTVITQTDAGAAHKRAKYNTKLPIALPLIVECELKCTTVGGNNVGFLIGYDGAAGTGGVGVSINETANYVQLETGAIAQRDITMTATINANTFYKVRAIVNGAWVTIYLDGTLLGTGYVGDITGTDPASFIGLWTWTAAAEFRNLKVWTLGTGLPA